MKRLIPASTQSRLAALAALSLILIGTRPVRADLSLSVENVSVVPGSTS